jgi:hypothetical protein
MGVRKQKEQVFQYYVITQDLPDAQIKAADQSVLKTIAFTCISSHLRLKVPANRRFRRFICLVVWRFWAQNYG